MQQRANDFDALTFADRHAVDVPAGIDGQSVARRYRDNPLRQFLDRRLVLHRERNVFGHRKGIEQGKMLEYHADAEPLGFRRRADVDLASVPQHLAGIRLHHAVDDFHQRALAGTVLADDGVDFARSDAQADVVVGDDGRICLADVAQFQPIARWHQFAHLDAREVGFAARALRLGRRVIFDALPALAASA